MSVYLTSMEVVQEFKYYDIKDYEVFKNYILEICNKHKTIKKMVGIIHDKDTIEVIENNKKIIKEKEPHFHIYLYFKSSQDINVIAKWFNVAPQYISKIKGTFKDAISYATHKNRPLKYQYSVEELILFNMTKEDYIEDTKNSNASDYASIVEPLLNEYLSNSINDIDLINALPPMTHLKYLKQIDNARKIRNQRATLNPNRHIKCLYFWGLSGTGKTNLAKYLGEKKYNDIKQVCISSSSNDILQDYLGQKVLVLDDYRSDSLSYADFIKMLDNFTNSTIKSRFSNKCIYDVKELVITTQFSPNELYNTKEDIKQLLRRLDYKSYYFDLKGVWLIRYEPIPPYRVSEKTLLSEYDLQVINDRYRIKEVGEVNAKDILF